MNYNFEVAGYIHQHILKKKNVFKYKQIMYFLYSQDFMSIEYMMHSDVFILKNNRSCFPFPSHLAPRLQPTGFKVGITLSDKNSRFAKSESEQILEQIQGLIWCESGPRLTQSLLLSQQFPFS